MNTLVDIIIPTMDNPGQLSQCLKSLINSRFSEQLFHIFVVNNGHKNSCDFIDPKHKFISVLQPGKNLGWMAGINYGLRYSKAPFFVMANDDLFFPTSSKGWLSVLLQHFKNPKVAAVGPSSNIVMGFQNMISSCDLEAFTTYFLIGFCMLVRKSAFDEVGGLDEALPGGDDFDLSIRLRDKDYRLVVDKRVFVFHYGMQTGNKVYGDYTKNGGWNSPQYTEKVNHALISKHGFRKWWELQKGTFILPSIEYNFKKDSEGELIRKRLPKNMSDLKILDLGCGNLKTVPNAIGVDIIPKNDIIEQIGGDAYSQADVTADVSAPLPFEDGSIDIIIARHILEHVIDPITTYRNWLKVLKRNGKIIISLPNEYLIKSIPMNPEHVHAWTPEFMKVFIETIGGVKIVEMWDGENNISFSVLAEKI